MKKIFQYMTTLLLLLVVGTSCEEGNDNWRIITDAQPGAYITGDATIYSATATSSQLVAAPLDGAPEGTNVIGIYTWLKSNGSFTILNVDEEGNEINYGKGDVVASTPAETVALAAGGTPFTVAEDGLYYVAMNKADNQLTIIPATFGIIGDATPLQWNGETAMQASYNETQATVEYTISDVTLDKKEMKFRYSGDWGLEFPYQGGKVKLHTNMGYNGDNASAISEAFSECKGGGANFQVGKAGVYTVTLKLDLRTGQFSAKAVCTAEDTSSATLPEKMFVNGDAWGWQQDWSTAPEMIPVHSHDGMFWGIYYLQAGYGMKFNNEKSWSAGGWADAGAGRPDDSEVAFTLSSDGTAYEAVAAGDGDLRIYVSTGIQGVDWWQSEFLLRDGKIEYRGKGGDQEPRVQIETGKTVTLDFRTNTGTIQ